MLNIVREEHDNATGGCSDKPRNLEAQRVQSHHHRLRKAQPDCEGEQGANDAPLPVAPDTDGKGVLDILDERVGQHSPVVFGVQ